MKVCLDSYWTPKAGNRDDEYEDAFVPGPEEDPETSGYIFAVADGATVSWHPRCWANLLVRGVIDGRLDLADPASLASLQQEWTGLVSNTPLPWYAEEMARKGAFAALVALKLTNIPVNEWQAVAVGDSCLFHLRDGVLLTTFPPMKAADFDLRPYLIGSKTECQEVAARLVIKNDQWQSGDVFLLMSDALARWFISSTEAGLRPQDAVALLSGQNQPDLFREWVDGLREVHALKNDDTTLLRIAVTE